MTTNYDRLAGVSDGLGRKAPARFATTGPVILAGLQAIDGPAVAAPGDRVVVWKQADAREHGVWNVSTGPWSRALDFDGPRDIAPGTSILVEGGQINAKLELAVSFVPPFSAGATGLAFQTLGGEGTSFQKIPGTILRTEVQVLRDTLTSADYGMRPGTIDDQTEAWKNLCANAPDGAEILMLPGTYIIKEPAIIENKSFSLKGTGRGLFQLRHEGFEKKSALIVNQDRYTRRLKLENMVFTTFNAGDGTAIIIRRPAGFASSTEPGLVCKGLDFWGAIDLNAPGQPQYQYGWATGIDITAGWGSLVEECNFRGKDGTYVGDFVVCREHTTPLTFNKNNVTFANSAVHAMPFSFSEGMNAAQNQIVAVRTGFWLEYGNNAPSCQIINNHINASDFGVLASNRPQLMIAWNLIYNWCFQGATQGSANRSFVGVQISEDCPLSVVSHNTILGFKGSAGVGSTDGIVAQRADASRVCDNTLAYLDNGINGVNAYRGLIGSNVFAFCTRNYTATTGGTKSFGNFDYTDANNVLGPF